VSGKVSTDSGKSSPCGIVGGVIRWSRSHLLPCWVKNIRRYDHVISSHHNNDDVTNLDVEHLSSYHFVRELEGRDGGVGIGENGTNSLG
jgi:hypothetical protein